MWHYLPGSVAETMAPKKRQSVKKKSPPSWPTTFMKDTKPYMISLGRKKDVIKDTGIALPVNKWIR